MLVWFSARWQLSRRFLADLSPSLSPAYSSFSFFVCYLSLFSRLQNSKRFLLRILTVTNWLHLDPHCPTEFLCTTLLKKGPIKRLFQRSYYHLRHFYIVIPNRAHDNGIHLFCSISLNPPVSLNASSLYEFHLHIKIWKRRFFLHWFLIFCWKSLCVRFTLAGTDALTRTLIRELWQRHAWRPWNNVSSINFVLTGLQLCKKPDGRFQKCCSRSSREPPCMQMVPRWWWTTNMDWTNSMPRRDHCTRSPLQVNSSAKSIFCSHCSWIRR